jgi:hypothetical protein
MNSDALRQSTEYTAGTFCVKDFAKSLTQPGVGDMFTRLSLFVIESSIPRPYPLGVSDPSVAGQHCSFGKAKGGEIENLFQPGTSSASPK